MTQPATRKFTLQELAQVVRGAPAGVGVFLAKSARWIDWDESSARRDAQVVSVDLNRDWPLGISFTGTPMDVQSAPFDEKMEFYLKKLGK